MFSVFAGFSPRWHSHVSDTLLKPEERPARGLRQRRPRPTIWALRFVCANGGWGVSFRSRSGERRNHATDERPNDRGKPEWETKVIGVAASNHAYTVLGNLLTTFGAFTWRRE